MPNEAACFPVTQIPPSGHPAQASHEPFQTRTRPSIPAAAAQRRAGVRLGLLVGLSLIHISCKSFTDASTKAEELAEAWGEQMTDEQLASMTQDDITAKIGEITMQAIDETQAIDMPLVLTFTKNDNEWTPDADVLGSLLNLFE